MKKHLSKFAVAALSVAAASLLTACGGGSSTGPSAAAPTPTLVPTPAAVVITDPVTTASLASATTIGASVIAGASNDEEVYNITADIGDSWQLVLNNKNNTYVINVLSTQYGLSATAAAGFTRSTVGAFTTITSTTGGALSVQIDARTKVVVGTAKVGSKSASIAGTAYAVADVSKLAGDYLYAGSARNVSNGQSIDTPIGGFTIAANGVDISVCDGSLAVSGVCKSIATGATLPTSKLLKVVKDGSLLRLKDGMKDFGILNVSAGDRGPVLIIDRFGLNDEPTPVLRTGIFFAAKASRLAGTELDGSFTCSNGGAATAAFTSTGNSYTVTNINNRTATGALQYNKAVSGSFGLVNINGAVIVQNNGETLSAAALALPLSTSLVVVVTSPNTDSTQFGTDKRLEICRKS